MLVVMIKRLFGIITFLALSLFLVMPVYAVPQFTKTTAVEVEDLDFRNSIIDWNGKNVDINFIWDKRTGGTPANAWVEFYFNGSQAFLLNQWNCDQENICTLVITESQKTGIKNIIFGRGYDSSSFLILYGTEQNAFYFLNMAITFSTLLNVNLGSVHIIDAYDATSQDAISYWEKNIILGDKDFLPFASITLDNDTTQIFRDTQKAQYSFVNKFTNVETVLLNYYQSKETTASPSHIVNIIWHIAFFADSQVIMPDTNVAVDFQIYAPTVCGILDLACVSRNLIGEFSNTIYNQLGAESMASGVMEIYDTLFAPVYIVNNAAWQNGILSIYLMLTIGVLYLIIKRVLT